MNDDELARMGANHTLHRLQPRRRSHRRRNAIILVFIALALGALFGLGYEAESARLGYGDAPAVAAHRTPKPTAVIVPPGRWEWGLYCKNGGRDHAAKMLECRRPGGYR